MISKPIGTALGFYTEETIKEQAVTVLFAAGDSYAAEARLFWQEWTNKETGHTVNIRKQFEIDVKEGVPNGDDVAFGSEPEKIYGACFPADSIEAGIRKFIADIERDRTEYGYGVST